MAGHHELAPRVAALGLGEMYLSDAPTWFRKLLDEANERGVLVNCKGIAADRCPVLLTLAEYERLIGG